MDESYSEVTHISSIVGLLVPVNIYTETRSKFYQIVPRVEKPLPDGRMFIDIRPPELHGCEFLKDFPNGDDDLKFKTFENVVDLIVTQKIGVYRSGYYITEDIKKVARQFGVNEKFYDLCWATLISMLEMKLAQEMIIPVMDGFQKTTVRSFSQLVKNMDLMRAAGMDKIMSIKNTENILGEVFYSDSKYSVFTQMVDIVAYLRNVTDCARKDMRSRKNE
jgi:hypothetical protein